MRSTQFVSYCLFFVCINFCWHSQAEGAHRISVGDHSLFLDCTGIQKGATVILLTGAGDDTTAIWDKVQPNVAAFSRVCSYDRMGRGQSDHIPRKQSETEIVEDLHQLLTNAKIPAPYVLVGHSMATPWPRGANTAVSANGNTGAVVWAYEKNLPCSSPNTPTGCGQATLHAYDANNIANETWNTNMNATRDALNTGGQAFQVPVVIDGKVIVTSGHFVDVYALLP